MGEDELSDFPEGFQDFLLVVFCQVVSEYVAVFLVGRLFYADVDVAAITVQKSAYSLLEGLEGNGIEWKTV